VLLGVPRLLGIDVPREELVKLGLSLGSDVGFFVDGDGQVPARAALVGGFGDEIRRVEAAKSEVLLIVPAYGCPTGPVYQTFDKVLAERQQEDALERAVRKLTGPEKQWGPKRAMVESRWRRAVETGKVEGERLFNDLAVPAYRVEPRLGQLAIALARATRETACITGSGSCIFFPTTTGKVDKLAERVSKLLEAVAGEEFGAGARLLRTRLV
jgi:4-diphosphocytidyl-2C-methyl-D-erythritol kinase